METEYEAKFYPIEVASFRKKLQELGAKNINPERIMRRVIFDHRKNPDLKCHYIRVRDEGDVITMSAKIHASIDGSLDDQKELVFEVNDFDSAMALVKDWIGLEQTAYQVTKRETWKLGDTLIEIDTWPGLETYTEIESKSEDGVREVAEKLGLDWEFRRITSVVEIYEEIYGYDRETTHKMMENLSFEHIPFTNTA